MKTFAEMGALSWKQNEPRIAMLERREDRFGAGRQRFDRTQPRPVRKLGPKNPRFDHGVLNAYLSPGCGCADFPGTDSSMGMIGLDSIAFFRRRKFFEDRFRR
jgi:hypothetical protein